MLITLDDIFGQADAVGALRQAWQSDRLPHAMIFSGPAGVGKGTTAFALAGLFLCNDPQGDRPCGRCDSCVVFPSGNHPDYHRIYRQLLRIEKKDAKARDLSVDVIRDYLIQPASLKASLNRGKVFVVEEAETMSASAQNAMLKTLEEPAGRTLIILLAEQAESLLSTIRSRSRMIRFGAIEPGLIRRELLKRGIDEQAARDAARFAAGSLGLAIRWLEDGVIERAGELESSLLGLVDGRGAAGLTDLLKKAGEAYADRQMERDPAASRDQFNREGLAICLTVAADVFARRLAEEPDPSTAERLCQGIDAAVDAESLLNSNVNVSLIFQQLAVTLESLFARVARPAE